MENIFHMELYNLETKIVIKAYFFYINVSYMLYAELDLGRLKKL